MAVGKRHRAGPVALLLALAIAAGVSGCGGSRARPSSSAAPSGSGSGSRVGSRSGSRTHAGSRTRSGSRSAGHDPRPAPAPAAPTEPRGGRTLFPGHLVVAYYGVVGTSDILGHTDNPVTDAVGVERQAAAYAPFGEPVQPAFELVATVASSSPGAHGTYSTPVSPALIARYLAVAHRYKLLLILDFQPGRGEFLPQVEQDARFLTDPSVGVALDPEWKLGPDQVPLQAIGSASAASVNAVSGYLSNLVERHHLPQKLFIVHEFRTTELPDRQNILFRPGLATTLQMDGEGPVPVKLASFRAVTQGAGRFHIGFKVFLQSSEDPTLLSPKQVMGLHPRPEYVSYQ